MKSVALRSDYADVQVDVELHCLYMANDARGRIKGKIEECLLVDSRV